MPTYQYRCRDCGQDLEVVQSFADDALTTCPACEGSLRKVFSAVGISFKGGGFYKTDTRSGGSSSKSSSSSSSSNGDSGSSSTSDSGSSSSTSESSTSSSSSESSSSSATATAST